MEGVKVVLIDGNSLFYRAFFALPTTLTLSSGQVINAVYGFASMLMRLLTDEEPDVIAVAFDTKAPTFRHERYVEYKAHRAETPPELISQMPLLKEFLASLSIPTVELDGYEADDVLATLASRADQAGNQVLVVTGDRDSFQLIDDNVRVMTTRKGITDIVVYDRQAVVERYGLTPEQIPDFLGLKGDVSDNIPGVPGIGEKTAAKLVREFGSIEKIYGELDKVKPERVRNLLAENREAAELGYHLALLDFNVPVSLDLEASRWGGWDPRKVAQAFDRLEFRTLKERFFAKFAPEGGAGDVFQAAVSEAGAGEVLAVLREAAGEPVGLSWRLTEEGSLIFAVAPQAGCALVAEAPLESWLSSSSDIRKVLASRRSAIFDCKGLIRVTNARPSRWEEWFDVQLAAYLLDSIAASYEPEALCRQYLGLELGEADGAATVGKEAALALAIRPILEERLSATGMRSLLTDIEMPLTAVLAALERHGVGVDVKYLRRLSSELGSELDELQGEIWALAGEEFNISSPQQLSRILFDKLGLSPGRKTKSKAAYATDVKVLSVLAAEHPIAGLVMRFRELSKLKSTYVDALPKLVDKRDGRLHTSFNQTVTATGRLSSSNPNLQNIPTRTRLGKEIRKAFIPPHKGERLLAADYSQIELRLLAHFSEDEKLISLFERGVDIHAGTAAEVFGVSADEVTPELRRRAKAVNFGIIYGISGFGLGEQLGVSAEEASRYIDVYLSRYPKVGELIERTVERAKVDGYVSTLAGRRRYLPELKSPAFQVRSFGERVAVNATLQGSAADIIKKAMISLHYRLESEGLHSRMVLQVHDELIFEVPSLEEPLVSGIVREEMEQAWPLSVPLAVGISFGNNWGEL